MNTAVIPSWYWDYKNLIESSITKYFDTYLAIPTSSPLESFKETIRYACQWWKKLRGIFALEFYLTLSNKALKDVKHDDDILKFCTAIEIIHAFSLAHDDLPCMDNDTLRRWEPTTWKKYGEYQAVLAGDMLNTLGFEIISDIKNPKMSQELAKLISHAIWFYGMVWWQIEDMYYEENISQLDENVLKDLHYKKTGRLIEASVLWWIIISDERANISIFKDFWRKIWLAFQLKDDLLDVEGTPEETGKSVWGEEKWFVYLSGVGKTRGVLHEIISDCKKIANTLGSEKINFLVDYMENRRK